MMLRRPGFIVVVLDLSRLMPESVDLVIGQVRNSVLPESAAARGPREEEAP